MRKESNLIRRPRHIFHLCLSLKRKFPLGRRPVTSVREEVCVRLAKVQPSVKTSVRPASAARSKAVRLVASQSVAPMMMAVAENSSREVDHKLHIVLDMESLAKLRWLKAKLEAATEAEVVRRALRAYELFEPQDQSAVDSEGPNSTFDGIDTGEHLYIRITHRMKAELDRNGKVSGLSYGQQIRQALRVMMQITRDVEAYKEELSVNESLMTINHIKLTSSL